MHLSPLVHYCIRNGSHQLGGSALVASFLSASFECRQILFRSFSNVARNDGRGNTFMRRKVSPSMSRKKNSVAGKVLLPMDVRKERYHKWVTAISQRGPEKWTWILS